ncbi:MAG: hypothetical protein ACKO96_37935, partial [Flammeovirgaceae bacterium]
PQNPKTPNCAYVIEIMKRYSLRSRGVKLEWIRVLIGFLNLLGFKRRRDISSYNLIKPLST